MKEERKMILTMLQEGKITAEEAQDLLEALALGQETSNERAAEQWAEVKERLERAGDVVEQRLEQARDQIGKRIADARVRYDAARDRADGEDEYPIEGFEDVVVTVERGFSQFAKELPQAIARLVNFDFGNLGGHTVEHIYKGAFDEGLSEATVAASTRNGSITWETSDEPGYKVVVTSKVRAEDEAAADERAQKATVWEATETGFRLTAGDGNGVSAKVHIVMPRGLRYQVESETRNGSIRGRQLAMTSAQFRTANGSIRLEDVDAYDVQTRTANGSIRIAGVVDTLRGTTAQGSIEARMVEGEGDSGRLVENTNWELRTTSGSIRAGVPAGEDVGYDIDLKTVNGRVRAQLPGFVVETAGGSSRRNASWQTSDFDNMPRRVRVLARTVNGTIGVNAGASAGAAD